MEYIEYPKMLYRGAEQTIVTSTEEEQTQRAGGWGDHGVAPEVDDLSDLLDEAPVDPTEPAKRRARRATPAAEAEDGAQ